MKLRAQITIDIEADDFVDAAEHQRKVESLMLVVKRDYSQADLLFRERRDRPVRGALAPPSAAHVHYTGRLHEYDQ